MPLRASLGLWPTFKTLQQHSDLGLCLRKFADDRWKRDLDPSASEAGLGPFSSKRRIIPQRVTSPLLSLPLSIGGPKVIGKRIGESDGHVVSRRSPMSSKLSCGRWARVWSISATRRGAVRLGETIFDQSPSILVPIVSGPLAGKRISWIDTAIGVGAARRGHALGIAGELAIARIAPLATLQAVAGRDAASSSRGDWSDCGKGGNSCYNGEGNTAAHGETPEV